MLFLAVRLLAALVLFIPGLLRRHIPASEPHPATPATAPTLSDSAHQAVAEFDWLWRFYWEASETEEQPALGGPLVGQWIGLKPPPQSIIKLANAVHDAARLHLLHCHLGLSREFEREGVNIIENGAGSRAVCPFWFFPTGKPAYDERLDIDAAISPDLVNPLRRERDSLVDLLDRAAAADPADDWLAGQQIRFSLDAGDTARALHDATTCHASAWWCTMLTGYVENGKGNVSRADSIFQSGVSQMPTTDRCAWNDLSVLLDRAGRMAYPDTSCENRAAINARIWWLSDPMWSEPGNERRAEHFARLVDVRLRSTDTPAQRWDWNPHEGGLAVREMMIRYGWPAYSYWAGHFEDIDHYTIYLGIRDTTIINSGIFATAEYPIDRVHTIPWWSAIADPWHAGDDAWTVSEQLQPYSGGPDFSWWPREHMAHRGEGLQQLPDVQANVFRRENSVLLLAATDITPRALNGAYGDRVSASLILSTGPGAFAITTHGTSIGSTDVIRTAVPADSLVVGMEYRSTQHHAAARTRFGVVSPPPLSELKPGQVDISQPIILTPPPDGTWPAPDLEAIGGLLSGTTALGSRRHIGVYWETYGFRPADTVTVSVRVSEGLPPAPASDLSPRPPRDTSGAGIAIEWNEPDPGRSVGLILGPHPIQTRLVAMDLSKLAPGVYTLTVSVGRPGTTPVSASRSLVIVR